MASKTLETENTEGDTNMARKNISWKTKGMNRDLSVSAFNPEFAFENINLRLATNESNTMLSWVNERGTKELTLKIDTQPWKAEKPSDAEASQRYVSNIRGTAIGTAVLNHQLVVITTDDLEEAGDRIYVFKKSDEEGVDLEGKQLYDGDLNLSARHPLETLVSYESENIQKVYWTDSLNQPRVINIAPSMDAKSEHYDSNTFDFVQELALEEDIRVIKMFGSGSFPAGVIQYAFTYYNKYGQESNVFYTTPLQYISYLGRGGSADSNIANSFKIEIRNANTRFDYLRIYSILRTSKDTVPQTKRVQDIEISQGIKENGKTTLTFIDNGLQGETIDPTELLYKGGEEIVAETMEQKDGTLFLGNIRQKRAHPDIKDELLTANGVSKEKPLADNIQSITEKRPFTIATKEPFIYLNTLSSPEGESCHYQGATGFKGNEYYRLGIQFQHKNGKWSEPYWIGDKQEDYYPSIDANDAEGTFQTKGAGAITVPGFSYTLSTEKMPDIFNKLYDEGYRRARPLFAVPKLSDRTILCQGVACPTMYRKTDRYADAKVTTDGDPETDLWEGSTEGKLYAQSSWLFRVPTMFSTIGLSPSYGDATNGGGKISCIGALKSQFKEPAVTGDDPTQDSYLKSMSPYLRSTEVMGYYNDGNTFYVDEQFATVHSPDIEFDPSFANMDFKGCGMNLVGRVPLVSTYGDIDIQTLTPAIGSDSAGFVHRSIVTEGSAALITAPFYNDYVVDDLGDGKYEAYHTESPAIDYPVYMWQKNGSLNNDIARNNRSAELLKKQISNYRLGGVTTYNERYSYKVDDMQLFDSDTLSIIKVDGHVYMGNVETLLTPTTPSRHYLIGNPWRESTEAEPTDFNSDSYYYLGTKDPSDTESHHGVWHWYKKDGKWGFYSNDKDDTNIGDKVRGLCQWRESVSMKYKSTPHIAVKLADSIYHDANATNLNALPMVEITRKYDARTLYGGTSDEALQALTWIPCGQPVSFNKGTTSKEIRFLWGDTYFQRFECLKTYPYTTEDKNQVVEIASFVCETRINIDGRYDRNRGQTSNLNMSPQNFNLLNPVYSQMDNFFSYKMIDEDTYKDTTFPNNVTWTKTKQNGADIDLWTNLTLANVLELDGDKGEITKLTRLNNQLLAFQDRGISQILYNENTQISTTEGVPIEIANSQKVQGKRYYTDTIGCSDKWSIAQTPSGIYFIDSNEKSIYLFNGQIRNLSTEGGFNTWAKQNIPSAEEKWNPETFDNLVTCYDRQNQEVLFISETTALAYSEKFGCFTSFYDYGKAPYLSNLDAMGIWAKGNKLWEHQTGAYCKFFGENKSYSMTLIGNQEPQTDKLFTNLEFRATVEGEGDYDEAKDSIIATLPFDSIETWDEYQHGLMTLKNRAKGDRYTHGGLEGLLGRKFRIWRCDIPRDNAKVDPEKESKLNIRRYKTRPLDRMRNPWLYLKLEKEVAEEGKSLSKTEVHDIVLSYFN